MRFGVGNVAQGRRTGWPGCATGGGERGPRVVRLLAMWDAETAYAGSGVMSSLEVKERVLNVHQAMPQRVSRRQSP